MERRAVRLTIRGRVQGVGYRWWAIEQARGLELNGWVRNRSDGTVELMAIGPQQGIEQLVGACYRGPPAAMVTGIDRADVPDDGSVGFGERSAT